MKTIYVITGPTAVGKTSLAIDWALENDAEIVSCDSLLFYKKMDIGTAKPTTSELSKVRHHCVDMVDASTPYNISLYLDAAEEAVVDIFSRNKNVLVTGGSGFYLKGFFAPVYDGIPISDKVEQNVDDLFDHGGLSAVVDALKMESPEDYDLIDLNNPRRVIPALKRCLASGLTVGELRKRVAEADFPFKRFQKKSVLLNRAKECLKDRIFQRTALMLEAGLIEEVRCLLENGIEKNPSASLSIGYREVIAYLRDQVSQDELEELINTNTFKLVKKQLKWFKHQISFDQVIDLDQSEVDLNTLFK